MVPPLHIRARSYLILLSLVLLNSSIVVGQSLSVWDFKSTDPATKRAMNRVDNLFREQHPEVELEHVGFFDQEYIPSVKAALLAGTGPDIIMLHPGVEYNEIHQYLEILNPYLEDASISVRPASLAACNAADGNLKALPLTVQGMGWYYNKELFREAGLDPQVAPEEWDDFLEACRVLKENNIPPIATGNNRPLTTEFLRRSLISAFFTDDEIQEFYGRGHGVSTDRFRTIMEFCRFLRDSDYFHDDGLFRPYFNYAIETFMDGKAAMMPGLISDIAHWKDYSDALGSDNIGYFPNLRHDDMARPGVQLIQDAGILICINNASEVKDLAFTYITHLFGEASQNILIEDLGLLSALVDSPFPVNKYPVLTDIREALSDTGLDPELYVPSQYISDLQFRLDDLLINTREISVDEYLIRLRNELTLY